MRNLVVLPWFGNRGICIHSSQDASSTCTQGLLYSLARFSYELMSSFLSCVWVAHICPAEGGIRNSHRAHWPRCCSLIGSDPSCFWVSVEPSSPPKVRNLRFFAHRAAFILCIWCWRTSSILEENLNPVKPAWLPLVSSLMATRENDESNARCARSSVRDV